MNRKKKQLLDRKVSRPAAFSIETVFNQSFNSSYSLTVECLKLKDWQSYYISLCPRSICGMLGLYPIILARDWSFGPNCDGPIPAGLLRLALRPLLEDLCFVRKTLSPLSRPC